MKTFLLFLLTLLAAGGIYIGLLYTQIVPAAPLAQSSQICAVALEGMGLYTPSAHPIAATQTQPVMATATPVSTRSAIDQEERRLDAEKRQLEKRKASLLRRVARAVKRTRVQDTSEMAPVQEAATAPKLEAIYDTMKPADVARIFDEQPDSEVARALAGMDENKAGQVLGAMGPTRAARLTAILGRSPANGNGAAPVY